jgi:predicted MPP superfamily phosphohydrolase
LRLIDLVLISGAVLGLLLVAYAFWIEPQWVEVRSLSIPTEKLPPGASSIRIVQISDLHSPSNLSLLERIPELVASQVPDVIVFTGDAANNPEGVGPFQDMLARLTGIAPTYAVRGNYDWGEQGKMDLFTRSGAEELLGTAVTLNIRGAPLVISGAPFWTDWTLVYGNLQSLPSERFVVFLGHTPDRVYDIESLGVDLYLAGHTHGGQVALPFYGALWTNSAYGRRFERGLSRVGETWLYVNRGIGMTAYLPKIRFLSRPEITVIDIVPTLTK